MNQQVFEPARQYALHRLETELSPKYYYHDLTHTRDDVVVSAELLASMEGIQGENLYLLRTAAWFHDLGFVEQPPFHELISARIAVSVLPEFGYTPRQVEVVRWAIFATIIPQEPRTLLERILTDADLNVLGRPDFLARNANLRHELTCFGIVFSDVDWYSRQLTFLENHNFFTESARTLYDAQKTMNIAALKNTLQTLTMKDFV